MWPQRKENKKKCVNDDDDAFTSLNSFKSKLSLIARSIKISNWFEKMTEEQVPLQFDLFTLNTVINL